MGAWGVSNYLSPPAPQGPHTLPHSSPAVNSLSNLLKSITDLWSQPPQRSFARCAGGLNRNELAEGDFATLGVPASLLPSFSFYLTFIMIFFSWKPAGQNRDKEETIPEVTIT